MRFAAPLAACCLALAAPLAAQTPPAAFTPPKTIPPPGLTLADTDKAELAAGAAALRADLDALARDLAAPESAALAALLPDAEIFHKAVDWALRYDEVMAPKDLAYARQLLARGRERTAQLRDHRSPWLTATGTILRGYRSKLDGSVQPYALVVPPTWPKPHRQMMVWLLGRGEKRTELTFFSEREAAPPQLAPSDTLVLIPYGRFCNATKFAGETDVFEALAAVRAQYHIDADRIAVAGFSMGGGSSWHLAAHHPGLWAVASPGAGFAETPIFTKALAPGKEPRTAWEQTLWRQYESTGIAANFTHLPTLAYTGELDGQKEASDLMAAAFAAQGLKLERFIGPQTAHKYHDATKAELTARFASLLAAGRDPAPRDVRFSTYTLRYADGPRGLRVEGLEKHWERADLRFTAAPGADPVIVTKNISALSFPGAPATVTIDGETLRPLQPTVPVRTVLVRREGRWQNAPADFSDPTALRKRPGLTGPVDDAFVDAFLFVRPSGKPLSPELGTWVEGELTAARRLWREVYRGDAPVKADRAVTEADLADRNLILWGDPSSNSVLAKIIAQLPVAWDAKTLTFRGTAYDAKHHAPILVFPNPLNPRRYVVLNSGITFRSEGYGNNALQTPKLPDWAVVDLRTPPGPRWPGKIVAAGFFDEFWR